MNAVANGSPLEDRIGELAEEFSERVRRGESPNVEEYAERYPDAAEQLRRILPALALVLDDDPTIDNASEGAAKPIPVPQNGILGDYRLRQEIGRGGMGVVYEAEQISLHRRVALKILPFAAVLDQRQIQRFKNEAVAAGQLDHPNIVDVYGVGCERSVHFYAMRFVEGETLATLIGQLRRSHQGTTNVIQKRDQDSEQPKIFVEKHSTAARSTERTATGREFFHHVARIGVEVAEALDHAHQQGVVHRDIKPANVIIDTNGKSWVTDFGLARIESGGTMTMTGDLLGTLRYMSPEQVLAKRVVIDHRTDIYSLGATLYELVTLQPLFSHEDRHELLRHIAFENPPPPRKLNKCIPQGLEIIILKALSKNANERFETAREFADDLQRFLDDKPILARRPGLWVMTGHWMRRHSAFVATVIGVLLFTTVVASISALMIFNEQANTNEALVTAQENFEESERQKRRAEEQSRIAQQRFLKAQAAEVESERQKRLAEQRAIEAEKQHHRAAIHLSIALLLLNKENGFNQTRTWLDKGSVDAIGTIELAKILVAERSEDRGAWKLLAEAYDSAGLHSEALEEFEMYQARYPNFPETHNRLAWLLVNSPDKTLRDPARAIEIASHAVRLEPKNSWFLNTLAVAHFRAGNVERASQVFKESISHGWDDGFNSYFLAMCYHELGDREEALRWYSSAIDKAKPALPIAGRELTRLRQETEERLAIEVELKPID